MNRQHDTLLTFLFGLAAAWMMFDVHVGLWFVEQASSASSVNLTLLIGLKFAMILSVAALSFIAPFFIFKEEVLKIEKAIFTLIWVTIPSVSLPRFLRFQANQFRPPRLFS